MKKLLCTVISLLTVMALMVSTVIFPASSQSSQGISVANNSAELYMQDFEGDNALSDFVKGSELSSAEIVTEESDSQNKVIKFDREEGTDTSIQGSLYKIFEVAPNTDYVFTVDANVTDKENNASSLTIWQGCGISIRGVTYSGDVPSYGSDFAIPENLKCDGNSLTTYDNDANNVVHFNIAKTNNWNTYTLSFISGANDYVAIAWHILYARASVMLDNVSLKPVTSNFVYNFNDGLFPNDLTMGSKTSNGLIIVDKGDGDKAVRLDFTTLGGATETTFNYGFYKIIPVKRNTSYTYSFDAKITNINHQDYINAYRGGVFFVGSAPSATAASSEWTSLLENANNVCYDGVIWNSAESAIKNLANGIAFQSDWGGKIGYGAEAQDQWHNYSVSFNSGENDYVVVANLIVYAASVGLELDNISFNETSSDFDYDFNNGSFPTGLTKGAKATQDGAISFVDKGSNDKAVQLDFTTLGGATQVTFDYGFYKIIPVNPNTNYTYSFDAKITNQNEAITTINAYSGGAFFVGSAPSATAASSEWTSLLADANNVCYDGVIWNSAESAIRNVPNGIVSPGWGGKIGFGAEAEDEWHNYSVSFNSGDNEYIVVANFIIYAGDVVLGLDNISLKEKSFDFECDFESADSINEFTKGNNLNLFNLVGINKAVKISKTSTASTSRNSSLYRIFEVAPNTNYIFSIDANVTDTTEDLGALSVWQGCGISVRGVTYSGDVASFGKDFAIPENIKYDSGSISTNDNNDGDGVIHLATPATNEWHTYTLSFNSGENNYVAIGWHIIYPRAVAMLDNVKLELDPIQPGTIPNGDFEMDTLYGFALGSGITSNIISDADNQYAEFTFTADAGTNNSVKLEKNVIIEPNTVYTLSMRMKHDTDSGWTASALKVLLDGNSIDLSNLNYTQEGNVEGNTFQKYGWGYAFVTKHTDWKDVEITFDSGNCTTFNFNIIKASAGSLCFDDITLTAVGDANAVLGNVNADENNSIDICDLVRLAVSLDNSEANIAQSADVNLDSVIDEYDVSALRFKQLFTVEGGNLAIDRISSVAPGTDVYMGDTIDYIVTIRNTGLTPISNIEYAETLPEGLAFVSGNGFVNDGQNISWPKKTGDVDGVTLLPNDVYILRYTVNVTSDENGKILVCDSATVKDINLDSISYKITEWTGTEYTLLKKDETDETQFDGCDFVIQLGEERANTDIKVLQLTDTQIIDSAQARTENRLNDSSSNLWKPENMEALCGNHIRSVIAQSKPDVIIVTGDNVYGEFDDTGTSMQWLCETMDSFKIPWIPIFGNHDNESAKGIDWQCEQFINSEYCVFERGDVTGNGNFTVGIATGDKLVRVLNMIDTNGSKNAEGVVTTTAGIYDDQIEMFEAKAERIETAQGEKVPSFMAFHIQTADFVEADKLYAENLSDTYTIGENANGDFGSKGSALPDTNIVSSILDFARNCNTEAVFVGHEHRINTAISYEGIKWVFGLKTGQYDTHTKGQIGGTEIVLNGSSFSVTHVYSKAPYFE